jgi:5-methyltetrahydropteroyltriglutamate--homocysteine methyltransferase
MADDFCYHIDHHGSLCRPAELLTARSSGDPAVLAAAEEAAVAGIVQVQRRLSLSAVGDGQFRRDCFESVVYDGVEGFEPGPSSHVLADTCAIAPSRRRTLRGMPFAKGRLAEQEAAAVLAATQRPVFVALPSPGYLAVLAAGVDGPQLEAAARTGSALADILSAEIVALAAQGVTYVSLGNPLYAPLLTVSGREQLAAAGVDVDRVLRVMRDVDELVPSTAGTPDTFRLGLDLTDGGPVPTTERGWDDAVATTFVNGTSYDRVCIDYPADEARRLPIDEVKPGLVLSLGLVDVSTTTLEDVDGLLRVCDAVVDTRGTDDVAFATNGGFAQSAGSGLHSLEEQKAKLRLVETLARYYWGNEI